MKKTMILGGAVIFLAFVLSGCPSPTGNGGAPAVVNPPPPAPGSSSLVINQPVYSVTWDDMGTVWGGRAPGTRTVSGAGGSGTISGGYLNFHIGTPTWLQPITNMWLFEDSTFSVVGVQATELWLSLGGGGSLDLFYESLTISGNNFRIEYVERVHLFVDRDVVVTSPRREVSGSWTYEGVTLNYTHVDQAFTLNLRAGWNAVHIRQVDSGTFTGTWENPTSATGNYTVTVSTADPGRRLRWGLSLW